MIDRRQQGALIFATPLLLVLMVTFTTLLIDGARLLLVQSKMESVVKSAATAAADEAQTCSGAPASFGAMQSRGLVAARSAGFDGEDSELNVIPGVMLQGASSTAPMTFTPRDRDAEMAQTNSAWVRYTRTEPMSALFPDAVFPSIALTAEAAARKEVYAILSASGATATVEAGPLGSLLGQLVGIPGYSLNATTLQSLESTLIGVGDLLSALGVDTITDLADEPLLDVLDAVVVLAGGETSRAGGIANDLSGAVGLGGLDAGAVFEVVGQPHSDMETAFPVYDFVMSVVLNSARAYNQSSAGLLSMTLESSQSPVLLGLTQSISLLGDVDLALGLLVDEPSKIVIGPARQDDNGDWLTTVRASDITLETSVSIELASGALGNLISTLSLGLLQVNILDDISIPLAVQVGGGEATMVNARCAKGGINDAEFDFFIQDSVANIQNGRVNGANGQVIPEPVSATILQLKPALLPGVNVCLDADIQVSLGSMPASQVLQSYELYCPAGQCDIDTVSSENDALQDLSISVDDLALDCGQGGLSGPVTTVLGGLVTPLTGLLSDVTEPVLRQIVSPLLAALGANLGGMQLKVLGAEQTGSQLVEQAVFQP